MPQPWVRLLLPWLEGLLPPAWSGGLVSSTSELVGCPGGSLVPSTMIPTRSAPLSPPSSDLQLRLETMTAESQEKMDAQAATIAKLNKALRGKLEVSRCQKWASAHPRAEPNWDRH